MKLESICSLREPSLSENLSKLCAQLSRVLLLLVAVELVTMPLTQHIWTWDGFLHGGQDFELGLLMIVVCICLVLLRAQHGKQRLPLLLASRRLLVLAFGGGRWSPMAGTGGVAATICDTASLRPWVVLTTPLLI